MLVKVYGATVQGINASLITIEVNCTKGFRFMLVGLPDASVKESYERIKSALQEHNYKFPRQQVVINMSPADIRKEGAAYDLPLAVGILAASGSVDYKYLNDYIIMGELSLDGSILPIKGALPIALLAKKEGYKGVIFPKKNAYEASVIDGLSVYGIENISEIVDLFNKKDTIKPLEKENLEKLFNSSQVFDFDFADVKGQENVKRALEVAAAGSHNIIIIGSPGSGKSMMAKRIPSILPPFTLEESLETTKIHSVAGLTNYLQSSLMLSRPFRSPHHTISDIAMVGGGKFPQPGEISLSHNGVLFLDELPEFNRSVLEVLRQPLEDRKIIISRAKFTVEYPASFMLVAAMNPCPCGYNNHPTKACICPPASVIKYFNRISGPLLDRIDIHIEINLVSFEKISDKKQSESSKIIRDRVFKARVIQQNRYKEYGIFCNSQMSSNLIRKFAIPDQRGLELLKKAMNMLKLSARAYDRILKLARTIADLEGNDFVNSSHIAEAIGYRNLDRES